jgi:pimeloyl-ACP methyl ester carboxylesterase
MVCQRGHAGGQESNNQKLVMHISAKRISYESKFEIMRTYLIAFFFLMLLAGCHTGPQDSTSSGNEISDTTLLSTGSHYAQVHGLKMYYEIHGAGYPLVLIHGGGSTIQTTFGRVVPALAEKYLVIAVELQAHGHTADIDRPLSFEQDADDVAELLNQLHIRKANVFGFSNGGNTTLEMAIRHPDLVNKLIVASALFKKAGAPSWFWDMMSQVTFESMPQPLKDAFLAINPDTNALHQMYQRDVTRMQNFQDIPDDQIKSIVAPTFIIIGNQDVVTPKHAMEMSQLLPHAELEVFSGGHGQYIGEVTMPQDTALISGTISAIEAFLSPDHHSDNTGENPNPGNE